MTVCHATSPDPIPDHTCSLTDHLASNSGLVEHECYCRYTWVTEPVVPAGMTIVPLPQPTVAVFLAAVSTVIEDIDAVLGWLHTIKRTLDGDELERLLVSIDRVQSTWAAATLARAALRDAKP